MKYTTKEAAEQLHVHARTVRKWIDSFADFVQPEVNGRGHYELSDASLQALQMIREQLKSGNKSLRQVRVELVKNGHIPAAPPTVHEGTKDDFHLLAESVTQQLNAIGERLAATERRAVTEHLLTNDRQALTEHLSHIEAKQQTTLQLLEQLHEQIEDVRKKQEHLKLEIRNATFDQRLEAAGEDSRGKRKKSGALRLSQLFR